jgi:hypothetical protein
MRAEFLNGELFDTMLEAQVLTQRRVHDFNRVRPHSGLGGRPPALEPLSTPLFGVSGLPTMCLAWKIGIKSLRIRRFPRR